MTVNPHVEVGRPEPTHPQQAPSRVRVQLANVTVDIELYAAGAVPPPIAAPPTVGEPSAAPPSPVPVEPVADVPAVRSPIVGTFYRATEPGAAPFVSVGDVVTEGQQIGIVEAMKLMNRIDADRPGRVTEILVADGSPVEYDQPLIAVEPQ